MSIRGVNHGQQSADQVKGNEAHRDVDEEDPVPGDVVGQDSAQKRTDEEGDTEHAAEQALVFAALGRGEEVTNHGKGDREQGACAETLNAPEEDQLPHRLAQARQHRSDQEQDDARQEHRLAPEIVRQLAVDRDRRGARHEVGGDDPGVEVGALELGGNLGQNRTNDGLVERAEEQRKHDGAQDFEPGARVDLDRWVSLWPHGGLRCH